MDITTTQIDPFGSDAAARAVARSQARAAMALPDSVRAAMAEWAARPTTESHRAMSVAAVQAGLSPRAVALRASIERSNGRRA